MVTLLTDIFNSVLLSQNKENSIQNAK